MVMQVRIRTTAGTEIDKAGTIMQAMAAEVTAHCLATSLVAKSESLRHSP